MENRDFKEEEEYKDIVYVMDGYTKRLKDLYYSREKSRQDRTSFFGLSIFMSGLYTISAFALESVQSSPIYSNVFSIFLITSFVGIILAFLMYANKSSNSINIFRRSQNLTELVYTRKQLIKLLKYVSQVLDNNEFSPPKKFLMDLKLSEAEEIIHLTKKIANKHTSKISKPDNDPTQQKEIDSLLDFDEAIGKVQATINNLERELSNILSHKQYDNRDIEVLTEIKDTTILLSNYFHYLLKKHDQQTLNYQEQIKSIEGKIQSLKFRIEQVNNEMNIPEKKAS